MSGSAAATAEGTSETAHDATEVAQVLAELISHEGAWPEEEVRDLARLLGHGLAAPNTADLRHARLGLLIELVSTDTGEFIDVDTYEAARKRKAAEGSDWPTASALSRAYGHWLAAVRAAMRFWFDGGKARVPADHSHAPSAPAYTPEEVIDALNTACEELHAEAITEWEYDEWRKLRRQAARRAGQSPPRNPSMTVVRKHFANFDAALGQAVRHRGLRR